MVKKIVLFLFFLLFLIPHNADSINLSSFKIKEFYLKNKMKFVVLENHFAPVVSFAIIVNAGSVNDPCGKTGLAHLLEHMAFKGTTTIGTKDWKKEKELTNRLDKLYKILNQKKSDKCLLKQIKEVKGKLNLIIVPNEFANIIEKNGGEDLNAQTAKDYTLYYCSLPSNKIELWFYLESNRLKDPVWREFYTEKKVVLEERRMRVDSNPEGKLFEHLLLISYLHHPYRNPGIGWAQNVKKIEKTDLTLFYNKFYNPQNITVVIVGDVDTKEIKRLAKEYFEDISPHISSYNNVSTMPVEPSQNGMRTFIIRNKAHTPVFVRAYHSTYAKNSDFIALDVLSVILGYGRTSVLYKYLVEKKHLASEVYAWNGFPGSKFPSLFVIYIKPNKDICLDTISDELDKTIKNLIQDGIKEKDLARAKKIITADLIKGMESNLFLAKNLAIHQVVYGDWREFFNYINKVKKITLDKIKNVMKKYLKKDNLTEGRLVN